MWGDPNPVAAYDFAITTLAPARPAPICRLLAWKPWGKPNPSLLGHCSVVFNGIWVIHEIPIFLGAGGSLSAGGPSAPIIGPDGRHKVDAAGGRKQYTKIVTFEANGRDVWSRAVLGALRDAGIDPLPGGAAS